MNILMKLSILILIITISNSIFSQEVNEPKFICKGSAPKFSPDGKKIVYHYNQKIWVYNLETNENKQISSLSWDYYPKWSPTGKQIIFQSYGDSIDFHKHRYSLWIVDVDGAGQRKFIEEHPQGDVGPYWSPDGKRIIWTRNKRLWISDSTGENAKFLNFNPAINNEYLVDWSSNLRVVLYLRNDYYKSSPSSFVTLYNLQSQEINIVSPRIYTDHAIFNEEATEFFFISYYHESNSHSYYLSKYNIDEESIEKNILDFSKDYERFINSFDISEKTSKIIFDNIGIKASTPKIYIMDFK